MSSSSYISQQPAAGGPGSVKSSRDGNNNSNFMDGDNLLKLALKKPKSWKWELTTSSSTPNISFPKIQLFDSRTGELMVSVDKPDCIMKSEDVGSGDGSLDRKNRDQRYRRSRSTYIREKIATSSEYLSDVFEQLQNKGMGHKLQTSVTQYRVEEVQEEEGESSHSLQKSKSANEIRRSVSLEQKKKLRKSPSCRSSSILGRISECYKSSTEEEPPRQRTPPPPPAPVIPEISIVEEPPEPKPTAEENKNKIYKLVRSNIGTLIVREESFHTQRSLRRRRQQEAERSIAENEPQVDKRITISDIPDSSYNDTIKEIDNLISKVMLSHTLQDVQESRAAPSRGRTAAAQNGKSSTPTTRRRRSRRSASAGSNASSYGSGSRRGRNSPLVTVPPGSSSSSSSDEDLIALAESRFGSLKRRGRSKYKRNSTGTVQEPAMSNGGRLVNGRKQQELNVRRSSIGKITTTSSSCTTNTVEIEECESFSLSSLRSSLAAAAAAKRQRSSEKSSSTSLSTLSPPSPATAGSLPNDSRELTVARDWERSLDKVELCSDKVDGNVAGVLIAGKLVNENNLDRLQDEDEKQSLKKTLTTSSVDPEDLYSKPIKGDVNGLESNVHKICVYALAEEFNVEETLGKEFKTEKDHNQLSLTSPVVDSVDSCSKQVNGEVMMYSSVCKIGDVMQIPTNGNADILNWKSSAVIEDNDKQEFCNKDGILEQTMVLSNDSVNWISNPISVVKEAENVVTEVDDSMQEPFTKDHVEIQRHDKLDSSPKTVQVEFPTRDVERSATLSSRTIKNETSPTKDCTAVQEKEELQSTPSDAPSPRKPPTFGICRFPRYMNEPSPSSLAWSYLPQLATSHSTSSLASLRFRPAPDNSTEPTSPQSESAVQRRQLKSYARRHHRSSFQLLP